MPKGYRLLGQGPATQGTKCGPPHQGIILIWLRSAPTSWTRKALKTAVKGSRFMTFDIANTECQGSDSGMRLQCHPHPIWKRK